MRAAQLSKLFAHQSTADSSFKTVTRSFYASTSVSFALVRRRTGQQVQTLPTPPPKGATTYPLADRLFSLHRSHQHFIAAENKPGIRQTELDAWKLVSAITEEELEEQSTNTVAEVLHTFLYFSKFWALGTRGPSTDEMKGEVQESEKIDIPIVNREELFRDDAGGAGGAVTAADSLPKRHNPLDDIMEL